MQETSRPRESPSYLEDKLNYEHKICSKRDKLYSDIKETDDEDSIIFLLTNARSLAPKIDSLVDFFEELDAHFCILSESWLVDANGLEEQLADFCIRIGHRGLVKGRSRVQVEAEWQSFITLPGAPSRSGSCKGMARKLFAAWGRSMDMIESGSYSRFI